MGPHAPDDFLRGLLSLTDHVPILESGDVEVVGKQYSAGPVDVEGGCMRFGGDVVDLCDGAGWGVLEGVEAGGAVGNMLADVLLVVGSSHFLLDDKAIIGLKFYR